MIAITLKKSALAQSSDIHYKLVIEVQGTSIYMSLQLLYKVCDCNWTRLIALLL